MRKFLNFSDDPSEVEFLDDWEPFFRTSYDDSLVDKSFFRPTADAVSALRQFVGQTEDGIFHFPDGRDDGRTLDTVPRRGEDISVLYQRTRELQAELDDTLSRASAKSKLEKSLKSITSNDTSTTSNNTSSTVGATTSDNAGSTGK